ncbi:hypothetical protein ACE6H2_025289 [Prunus campanulata]
MGTLQVEETLEASAATPAGNFLIKHESNAVKGSLPQKKKKLSLDEKKLSLISGLLGPTHGSVPQPFKFVLRPKTCLYFA